MFAAGSAMPAPAEYPDLVNKIALLQLVVFGSKSKYTMPEQLILSA
jgi:hypothetical protein